MVGVEKRILSVALFLKRQCLTGILRRRETDEVLLVRRASGRSNPGVYQASVNGKLDDSEDWLKALRREVGEELGEKLAESLDFSSLELVDISPYIFKGKQALSRTYVGQITKEQVEMIKLSEESDRILWVGPEDIGMIKTTEEVKKTGFDPDKEIVMFPDQLRALKKIFELEKKQKASSFLLKQFLRWGIIY